MSTEWQQQREAAEEAVAATLARMANRDAQHWAEQGGINGDLITGVEQLGGAVQGLTTTVGDLRVQTDDNTGRLNALGPIVADNTDTIGGIVEREGVVRAAVSTLNGNVSSVATHSTINAREINKLKRRQVDWFVTSLVAIPLAIIVGLGVWYMLVVNPGIQLHAAFKALVVAGTAVGAWGLFTWVASLIFKKKVTLIAEDVLGTPVHLSESVPTPTRTSGVPARPNPPPPTLLTPAEGPVLRLFDKPQRA